MLAIAPESLDQFQAFCERERCPFAVIGMATEERQLVLEDPAATADDQKLPVDMPMTVLLGKPPKMHRDVSHRGARIHAHRPDRRRPAEGRHRRAGAPHGGVQALPDHHRRPHRRRPHATATRWSAPGRCRWPTCAVTLADYKGFAGEAMSMGERTPLAAIDAPASGRMAVAEAITNLLAAPIELPRVKLSANWMAACGEPGEDAALYDTVKAVGLELCPALGVSIPVGKDSLSMRTQWQRRRAKPKKVTSPVSLIVTAFATLADVRGTLTPQLDATEDDTTLVLIDLGRGQKPHGRQHPGARCWTRRRRGARPRRRARPEEPGGRRERAARAGPDPGLPRPQRRRPVRRGLRDGLCRPCRRGAERRHAGHRRRRHLRQPHGNRRRQELGAAGQRAPRRAHAQGAVQRRAGRGAAGAHGRAQRGHADAARARPLAPTATSSARRARPAPPSTRARASCRVWRDAKAVFSASAARPAPGLGHA